MSFAIISCLLLVSTGNAAEMSTMTTSSSRKVLGELAVCFVEKQDICQHVPCMLL